MPIYDGRFEGHRQQRWVENLALAPGWRRPSRMRQRCPARVQSARQRFPGDAGEMKRRDQADARSGVAGQVGEASKARPGEPRR